MIANYHTHTTRCHHARGTEREYIEQALANGIKILGFSDHSIQIMDRPGAQNHRMAPEEIADYCQVLEALRSEYAGRIQLHIGFEMEYYPRFFRNTMNYMKEYPIEYLILGQHFLGNEDGGYTGAPTEDEKILAQYVDQTLEGLYTGAFTYFAHPDLIAYRGPDPIYTRHITRLCETAKQLQIPLEVNVLGLETKRCYPRDRFWEIASEVGCDAVIGCDAHDVHYVGNPEFVCNARQYLARFGITPLEQIPLRDPFRSL